MIRRATMGDIRLPFNYSSKDTYLAVLIQCVNGRDCMSHRLWCHGLDGFFQELHMIARVEIPTRTFKEFITNYLTAYRRRNRIIGQYFVNGNVQLFGIPEVWDSSL